MKINFGNYKLKDEKKNKNIDNNWKDTINEIKA
jgi:hypothetical protein